MDRLRDSIAKLIYMLVFKTKHLPIVILMAASIPSVMHAQIAPATPRAANRPARSPLVPSLPPNIPPVKGLLQTAFALRYIEIQPGTGALAEPGEKYTVHYTGWLHDGTKFDSSVDRGTPFEFIQGQHRVIVGWDEGFLGMRVGGKRRLFIPWQLAYGANGRDPIPPKADLIFDVELLNVVDLNAPPAPPASQLPNAGQPPK